MKTITKIFVAKDSEGNERAIEYGINVYETVSEALRYHTEGDILRAFNAWLASDARQGIRFQSKL